MTKYEDSLYYKVTQVRKAFFNVLEVQASFSQAEMFTLPKDQESIYIIENNESIWRVLKNDAQGKMFIENGRATGGLKFFARKIPFDDNIANMIRDLQKCFPVKDGLST